MQDPTNPHSQPSFGDSGAVNEPAPMANRDADHQGDHTPGPVKVVSARQLEANRRNAKRSTGPTSAAGKARVSRNALKHGIYADIRPIEQGLFREDPLAVQAMVDGVLDAFKPRNAMERAGAIRIANVMLQIGRYHAMESFDLERLTRRHTLAHLAGPGLFEAQYNAEFYAYVAEILERSPTTYSLDDWHDLLLAGAAVDDDLRNLYSLLDLDDPAVLDDSHDLILLTLASALGGSLASASRMLAAFAEAEAEALPDATAEADAAGYGIRYAQKQGTYESHTRILSRLSAVLDREIKRYTLLRDMADETDQTAELEEEDDDDLYDDVE